MKRHIFLFLLGIFSLSYAGFDPNTLIYAANGLKTVGDLKFGALVVSSVVQNSQEIVLRKIRRTRRFSSPCAIAITIPSETIIVSNDQRVYDPTQKRWAQAKDLAEGQFLLAYQADLVPIVSIEIIEGDFEWIEISVDAPHTLAVGESGIVMHNVGLETASFVYMAALDLAPAAAPLIPPLALGTVAVGAVDVLLVKALGTGIVELVTQSFVPRVKEWFRGKEPVCEKPTASCVPSQQFDAKEEYYQEAWIEQAMVDARRNHPHLFLSNKETKPSESSNVSHCVVGDKNSDKHPKGTCGTGLIEQPTRTIPCGTGKAEEWLEKKPKGTCGTGLMPIIIPERGPCIPDLPEPEPLQCNWSRQHGFPSLGEGEKGDQEVGQNSGETVGGRDEQPSEFSPDSQPIAPLNQPDSDVPAVVIIPAGETSEGELGSFLTPEKRRTPEEIIKEVLEGTEKGKQDKSKQFIKPGNFETAKEDFERMKLMGVKETEDGKIIGQLTEDITVIARSYSSTDQKYPTLEIQYKKDGVVKRQIKIRYTG